MAVIKVRDRNKEKSKMDGNKSTSTIDAEMLKIMLKNKKKTTPNVVGYN